MALFGGCVHPSGEASPPVSSSGGIMIARQRIQIGRNHARAVVTVCLDEDTITVHHGPHLLATTPRTTTGTVARRRANNH